MQKVILSSSALFRVPQWNRYHTDWGKTVATIWVGCNFGFLTFPAIFPPFLLPPKSQVFVSAYLILFFMVTVLHANRNCNQS